jgi:tetratricopeptide (TPR) repeat protein
VPGLPSLSLDEMRGIVKRLTELVPKLAVTCSAQSFLAWSELDYVKAREYGQRAVQADPNCALAHLNYGFMLNGWGWPVEGRKEIEKGLGLAPSKVSFYRVLAHTYYMERDFPKAIAAYREALRWEPHHLRAYHCIAEANLAMGDYLTSISNRELTSIIMGTHDAASKAWYEDLRQAFKQQGPMGYWQMQEKRFEKEPSANLYDHADCQMHLGHTNTALDLLHRSCATDERSEGSSTPRIYALLFDDVWDGVRGHPRFRELLDKTGFTRVMPKRP